MEMSHHVPQVQPHLQPVQMGKPVEVYHLVHRVRLQRLHQHRPVRVENLMQVYRVHQVLHLVRHLVGLLIKAVVLHPAEVVGAHHDLQVLQAVQAVRAEVRRVAAHQVHNLEAAGDSSEKSIDYIDVY